MKVGTVKYGGQDVLAWELMSASELGNLVFTDASIEYAFYLTVFKNNLKLSIQNLDFERNFVLN